MNLTKAHASLSPSHLSRWAPLLLGCGLLCLLLLLAPIAHAATNTSAGNLPWETPLQKFRDSISGPVAFAIALMGIIVCGAMLIWGGEINEFVRRFVMVILVVAILVLANTIMSGLFNTGAVISAAPPATPADHGAVAPANPVPGLKAAPARAAVGQGA